MEQYGELNPSEVYCHCDRCGQEIYVGEECYDINGEYICEKCISRHRITAGED